MVVFKTTQYGVIAYQQFGVFLDMGVQCITGTPFNMTKRALVVVIRQFIDTCHWSIPALSNAFWISYVEKALVLNECFFTYDTNCTFLFFFA